MREYVTVSSSDAQGSLEDWRVLLRSLHATFRAGSFEAASGFVQKISVAADAADHHPDLDLRYPDIVHVALKTHAVNDLTTADVELARTISSLASAAGIRSEPRLATTVEVALDALDIEAVRPFWRAILGYVDEPGFAEGEQVVAIMDPARIGPPFWFQQMDEPRTQRNRFHIDVTVPHDVAEERMAAAIAAGGRLLTDQYAKAFWVLADPEGNEACICTWQDRD